ncbi:Hypothetical Protein FCC1311_035962 [Hondaea fermentalgiana]|uniref:Mediator of RNA polymerase II transcription subunit 21 n=1 Tax=Hondaea fermentalgiana TaxID=2315210 RepID=A0A2R5GHM3_9STRA|nr:Hypothetical Protein FCC1311_035962 [Hondaea fermentalgiana]|eukprot:GBG27374.1 Hypothetical Protein FCC1311_035962 [Hondaea fermentalgiana]
MSAAEGAAEGAAESAAGGPAGATSGVQEAAQRPTDSVTALQDELIKLGQGLATTLEDVLQMHAPENVPMPPPGEDPAVFYQNYWQRQREKFATRGFENLDDSAAVDGPRTELRAKAREMVDVVRSVGMLMADNGVDRSEDDQLRELEALGKENVAAHEELEHAVEEANVFLSRVADMQRRVAAGALDF